MCVGASLRDSSKKQGHYSGPLRPQNPRQCCSVTAVITLPTQYEYRLPLDRAPEFFRDDAGDGVGSVFHQQDRRDAVFFGRQSIDLAHLGGCQDFLHILNKVPRFVLSSNFSWLIFTRSLNSKRKKTASLSNAVSFRLYRKC